MDLIFTLMTPGWINIIAFIPPQAKGGYREHLASEDAIVVRPANRPLPHPTRPAVSVLSSQETEPREALITFGMGHVSMANFPKTVSGYFVALKYLVASGQVSVQRRPEKILRVTDTLMSNFPDTVSSYFVALKHLLKSGQVTLYRRPERILRVSDTVMTTIIGALDVHEFTTAFDAACSIVSVSWSWLTTYNATDVERLHIASTIF